MVKMTEKQLSKRDTKRNIGEELLQAARESPREFDSTMFSTAKPLFVKP